MARKTSWYVRLFDIRSRKVYLCVYLFMKALLGTSLILKPFYICKAVEKDLENIFAG